VIVADGRADVFVAHAVARNRWWTRVVAALNAQWIGPWNVGPRAHPDDALLDVYEARIPFGQLRMVRARLPTGSHLPHPGVRERRTRAATIVLDRPLGLWLDGEAVGPVTTLEVSVEADALRVVV
jgi:diacylglycerol kinase family enzyme